MQIQVWEISLVGELLIGFFSNMSEHLEQDPHNPKTQEALDYLLKKLLTKSNATAVSHKLNSITKENQCTIVMLVKPSLAEAIFNLDSLSIIQSQECIDKYMVEHSQKSGSTINSPPTLSPSHTLPSLKYEEPNCHVQNQKKKAKRSKGHPERISYKLVL